MKLRDLFIIDLEYYVFSVFRRGTRWELRVWDLTEAEDHWIAFVITEEAS